MEKSNRLYYVCLHETLPERDSSYFKTFDEANSWLQSNGCDNLGGVFLVEKNSAHPVRVYNCPFNDE